MKVKIHRICKDNPLPTQANPGDAGYDVYAAEDVVFEEPGYIRFVPLGIIAQAPKGYHFKLCIRSSMAVKRDFRLANSIGIIDNPFSGEKDEIKMIIQFMGGPFGSKAVIKKGERVGQLILEKNNEIEWDEQEDRNFAQVSRGGFGSSGI